MLKESPIRSRIPLIHTDLAYLENYTAGGWVTAPGTGAGVSEADMNEIMNESFYSWLTRLYLIIHKYII